MKKLFNDGWNFAELSIDYNSMFKDGNPILFSPDKFLNDAQTQEYKAVRIPHDWQIHHVSDLYKNSVGFYKKTLTLTAEEVKAAIEERDYDDMHRPVGALTRTPEQVYIDSSNMKIEEVIDKILSIVGE